MHHARDSEQYSGLTIQVYISSRTAKACEETAARLTKEGPGECIAIPADLAKYDECEKLVKEIEKREQGELPHERLPSLDSLNPRQSCMFW